MYVCACCLFYPFSPIWFYFIIFTFWLLVVSLILCSRFFPSAVAIFRWILLNFRCIKTGAVFVEVANARTQIQWQEKTASPKKWCWCQCLDFIIQANRLFCSRYTSGIRSIVYHTFGSYMHNSTWVSYTLCHHHHHHHNHRSHYCSCFVSHNRPTNAFNQRATFTIQIIFLNVFEFYIFFHFATETISFGMVDDIMYCSWLVRMTHTLSHFDAAAVVVINVVLVWLEAKHKKKRRSGKSPNITVIINAV